MKHSRGKFVAQLVTVVAVVALTFVHTSRPVTADDAKLEFFENRIRPVLVEHCYKCHSATSKNVRGGLLLDSKAGVVAGGESGPIIVPSHPEESLLISSLKHESFEMPPDRKLPDTVIADFERWIRDGAIDPREGGKPLERKQIDLTEGRKFWSFQPIAKPTVPTADGSGWAKTEIDHFIAAKHAATNSRVAADASAEQVVRRLYFGLTGLPPTADAIQDFKTRWTSDPDQAIAETADELLQSYAFGERWGRHWLDVTRFAESSGGGRSLMFPEAWRFRDYAIQSFNNDKPINQLIREHIAGDLLPFDSDTQHDEQVTAVGFLALGPTNYEQQDKELLRMEVIDEQIDTIGRAFLGLTVGCARCHDHKFDPIPTADYYAMAGIFRSTETLLPGNVSGYVTTKLKTSLESAAHSQWEQQEKKLQAKIAGIRTQLKHVRTAVKKEINVSALAGIVVDDTEAHFEGEWVHSTSQAPFVGKGYRHDDYKKSGRTVRFTKVLPKPGKYLVRMSHNYTADRCSRLPVQVTHAKGTTTVEVDQRKSPDDGVFATIGTFDFSAESPAEVFINTDGSGKGVVIVDAIQFLPAVASDPKVDIAAQQQQAELAGTLSQLEEELTKHQKQKPVIPAAMAVRDQPEPDDWHIHVRGGIRNLGPKVPRGFLSIAGQFDKNGLPLAAKIDARRSGRRELADWVVSPTNPLTARVFVNRVWMHLVGEGLVRTPDNFGSMGQQPTHPELLDYLAQSFMEEDQWSVKRLIRRIVSSRIYRISAETIETQLQADPNNLLLTRAFRRRLDVEALRDSILQISGSLDRQVQGGRTISKLTQYDNGYDHRSLTQNSRSVYVPFFRNSMLEMFEAFDIANSNLVTGKRNVSTLPSQALFLLNSPFMLEQSEKASVHFLLTQSASPDGMEAMIDELYLQVVGRRASSEEQQLVAEFLVNCSIDKPESWTPVFQALFASIDFRYVD